MGRESFVPESEADHRRSQRVSRTKKVEALESFEAAFEQAKKELADFLNTPWLSFIEEQQQQHGTLGSLDVKNMDWDELMWEGDAWTAIEAVQKALEEKVQAFASQAVSTGKGVEAITYLEELLIHDKADESNRPALFSYQNEFDIVAGYFGEMSSDSQQTYRSFFYTALINGMKACGEKSIPSLVKALQEMKSFTYGVNNKRFKIGKDISKKEYSTRIAEHNKSITTSTVNDLEARIALPDDQLQDYLNSQSAFFPHLREISHEEYREQLRKQISEELSLSEEEKYEIESWQTPYIEEDLREDKSSAGHFIYGGVDYAETEFGLPCLATLNALRELGAGKYAEARAEVLQEIRSDSWSINNKLQVVTDILNQEPTASAQMMMAELPRARSEIDTLLITRLLYRIELGKIGLSGNFVEYLGKRFDISDVTGRAAFAHRVTGDGKVALFDDKGNALKYFHLTELDQPEKVTKAELLEFTLDTLFYPKPDETTEERAEREQILEEFKANYFKTYLSGSFYEQTKVMFNNLSLREQGWFLWYVQHADAKEKKRAMAFIQQYREDGFKTFLSLSFTSENGKRIIDIGLKNTRETSTEVNELFKIYNSLTEYVENFQTFLSHFRTSSKAPSHQEHAAFISFVLKKAQEVLLKMEKADDKEDLGALLKELRLVSADTIAFVAASKAYLTSEPEADIADIQGLEYVSRKGGVNDSERAEMEKIIEKSYQTSALKDGVLASFRKAMNDPKTKVSLLKHNDRIVSFIRFDPIRNEAGDLTDVWESGSFITDTDYRQAGLGRVMAKNEIDREVEAGITVVGATNPHNEITQFYVNDVGYAITAVVDYKQSGVLSFFVERKKWHNLSADAREVDLGDTNTVVKKVQELVSQGNIITAYKRRGDRYFGEIRVRPEDCIKTVPERFTHLDTPHK